MKSVRLLLALVFLSVNFITAQPAAFSPRGIGGGGALFFPTINPNNSSEYYVSCDMSEMFHTTDFGNSYSQIDFQQLQSANTSTVEFTSLAGTLYSSFNDGNNVFPVKSVDGGATWNALNAYDLNTYGNVYTLKANPNSFDQLVVGAYGDLLFSNDGGQTFNLIRHAANMGAGLIISGVIWQANSIYIGTNEGLLYSTNGGTSFSMMTTSGLPAGQVIWSMSGGTSGANSRLVCITADVGDVYNGVMPWDYYGFAKGVYVMNNYDGIWHSASAGIDFANDFVMYAAMAQTSNAVIYLGGNDNLSGGPLVYRSVDGGNSWTKQFNTAGNSNIITGWEGAGGDKGWGWSETCFGISTCANDPKSVIFSGFSNVQVSSDSGSTWKQAYVNSSDQHPAGASTPQHQPYHSIGLENTTCWQVTWQSSSKMMACYSDIGGIRSLDAGDSWGFQYTGFSVNSFYRLESTNNGIIYGACSNIHDMYQSTRLADAQLDANDGNGKIVYSNDDGATWQTLHSFGHPVFWLAVDPNNQNTMYAAVIHYGGTQGSQLGGIYKTNDLNNLAGATWTKLSNPPRTEGHPASINVLNDGKVVCTFSGRRATAGFTASSGVFIYDPGLNSWSDVSDNGMHYWTKDLVVDPTDPAQNTWYVCVFSGWGGAPNGLGGLYKTTNRGQSWTKLTAAQFDRVSSITFNPQNLSQAYLTTETQGLWVSNDMNSATPTWSLVNSYNFRQPERVFFNPYNQNEMWVTSFGNGMKVGDLTNTGIAAFDQEENYFQLAPNPASDQFTVMLTSTTTTPYKVEIVNPLGQVVKSVLLNSSTTIDVSKFVSGIYFVNLFDGEKIVQRRKMIVR
jgi:hypothetical protein